MSSAEAFAKNLETAVCHAVGVDPLRVRIVELETEANMVRDVEAWSMARTVVIRQRIGVFLAQDFQSGKVATSQTIHGALFALRAKVEGGGQ